MYVFVLITAPCFISYPIANTQGLLNWKVEPGCSTVGRVLDYTVLTMGRVVDILLWTKWVEMKVLDDLCGNLV